MIHVTLTRVDGCSKLTRKVLERNALDILTMDEDADFETCLEFVESATRKQLICLLANAAEQN